MNFFAEGSHQLNGAECAPECTSNILTWEENMKIGFYALGTLLSISVAACGGGSNEGAASTKQATTSSLYRQSSIVQCQSESSNSKELATLVASLKSGGATISSSSCGIDSNKVVATVCGNLTNGILVIDADNISPELIQSNDLHPIGDLPGAKLTPCN